LFRPDTEHGAVHALEFLPAHTAAGSIRRYAREQSAEALKYHGWWGNVTRETTDDKTQLLADSLRDKAIRGAVHALRALHVLSDRETIAVALENLQSRDLNQRANALETLESVREAEIVRPLLKVWDPSAETTPTRVAGAGTSVLEATLEAGDAWIRACAVMAVSAGEAARLSQKLNELAQNDSDATVRDEAKRALNGGGMDTLATLSLMERILFLRRVPLFADLSPADLKQVAAIASEELFGDGDVIAEQGEMGSEMFVIVSGEVSVRVAAEGKSEVELARRKVSDVVGEMSLISQEPRVASLWAAGEVRTLCIDRKSFEGLLRERPETCLAVMRVLCARLKELSK